MSHKLNQHFVPQFHLRLFAEGKRFIHIASRNGDRFVKFASIKGQCARHKFYGSDEIETWLGRLEAQHAIAYRAILDIAWNGRMEALSAEEDFRLREAIVLQRSRTPRAARMLASGTDQVMLYAYREYLMSLPASAERQVRIDAINCGKAAVKNSELASLVMGLGLATRQVKAIADLSLLILRNHSGAPYVRATFVPQLKGEVGGSYRL